MTDLMRSYMGFTMGTSLSALESLPVGRVSTRLDWIPKAEAVVAPTRVQVVESVATCQTKYTYSVDNIIKASDEGKVTG